MYTRFVVHFWPLTGFDCYCAWCKFSKIPAYCNYQIAWEYLSITSLSAYPLYLYPFTFTPLPYFETCSCLSIFGIIILGFLLKAQCHEIKIIASNKSWVKLRVVPWEQKNQILVCADYQDVKCQYWCAHLCNVFSAWPKQQLLFKIARRVKQYLNFFSKTKFFFQRRK